MYLIFKRLLVMSYTFKRKAAYIR